MHFVQEVTKLTISYDLKVIRDNGLHTKFSSKFYFIPWICYEKRFSEFYLSVWNQVVFDQRLQLFVQSPQPYLLILAWRN